MFDILISAQSKSYEDILNTHENIVLQAIREELNLSDVTQMANENKYMLRNCFKVFINLVPIGKLLYYMDKGTYRFVSQTGGCPPIVLGR